MNNEQELQSMPGNTLFNALDKAGITYSVRFTPRGLPYAGLSWSSGDQSGTLLTLLLEEDVLRITVHSVALRSERASNVTELNNTLPLGSVYLAPEDGVAEINVGLFIGDNKLDVQPLRDLLNYVDATRHWIENGGEVPVVPSLSQNLYRPKIDLERLLSSCANHVQKAENGINALLTLNSGLTGQISLTESDTWVIAKAHYQPPKIISFTVEDLSLLYRLQRWATSGRFCIKDEGELWVEVRSPLLPNSQQDLENIVIWTVIQTSILLRTAAKHYHFDKL